MSASPITALAAVVQAQIAAAMDRDLSMMMESNANTGAGAKTAAPGQAAPTPSATAPAEAQPGQTLQPPAAVSMTQAVDTARATAAGRQGGMALLFADLGQALASPALPAPVKAVVRQILAFQTPLDKPPSGQTIARAAAQSGLFLEAHLAAAGDSPPGPDLKAALLTLRQALATPDKATSNLAPRITTSPTLPSPAQPSAPRDQATATPTPDPARAAPPARPAAPAPSAPNPTAPPPIRGIDQAPVRQSAAGTPAADLARALETPSLPAPVRAVIGQVLAQQAASGGTPTELTESPPPPPHKAALPTPREPLAAPDGDRMSPAPPRTTAAAPPSRDAATTAQAPARSSLPEHADVATITEVLTRGVDQAVARQTLHQLASLPDGAAQAWMFELPLATPQGTTVAQFEIDRDGPDSAGQDGADGWRVRFSIDMEPLGPLHVHLHAGGGRASVNVWAERPTSLAPLRSLGGELSRALKAEIRFQAGAPSQPVPQPGHFLDAST